MKENCLPEKLNAYRLAEAKVHVEGIIPINGMARFRESEASSEDDVQVDMQFGVDEQGIRFVKGRVSAKVTLQCQRCMEPYVYGIIADFLSGFVRTEEEANSLPERYDPIVVVEDDMFLVHERIEDELIISLPIVPLHDAKDCKVNIPNVLVEAKYSAEGETNNPFKVIEIFRKKRES